MKVGRTLITLALVLAQPLAFGQSVGQWTSWGDAAMERQEFYGASRYYAGALELEPGRMNLQWKAAEACRLSHQYSKSAGYYDKVQHKDMGRTYPLALRWLAEMQMCQGAYADAKRNWNKLLQKEKDKDSITADRAAAGIAGCDLAVAALAAPTDAIVEHLPQPVNTYDSEFGARIGPDSALYFTSLRGALNRDGEVIDTAHYRARIFRSGPRVAGWQEPTTITDTTALGDAANSAWSLDGKRMFFTRCVEGSPCRIHSGRYDGTTLVDEGPLAGLGEAMSTQPMVARWDGREMLLFVTDREGGIGGMDIWQAELQNRQAKFLSPLGRPVNTPGDERTPWYETTANVLWFSSDFLPGMGGFDIFSAAFGNDVFATPVNAESPINSPANDLYPSYYPSRNEGWFTSNRIGSFASKGETCCNDLYRYSSPSAPVATVVLDPDPVQVRSTILTERLISLQQRFPLKLYFHNDDPDPRSWETSTPQTYGQTYARYKALVPDYEREQEEPSALQTFFRDDVDHGYQELRALIDALEPVLAEGGTATLEVRGHASPLARNDYNQKLSQRRIESLRNHLRTVDDGRLRAYMDGSAENGATLTIRELPFGEERSAGGVSDDLGDLKRSVYSVAAARERRIEIEALQVLKNDRTSTTERFVASLGQMAQGEPRDVLFKVTNKGDVPMRLLSSKADCGCTTAQLPDAPIAPNDQALITVRFNGRAPDGPLKRTVVVDTDGDPARIELVIEGTVVP